MLRQGRTNLLIMQTYPKFIAFYFLVQIIIQDFIKNEINKQIQNFNFLVKKKILKKNFLSWFLLFYNAICYLKL